MKKLLIILSLLLISCTFCFAQNEKKQDKSFQNGIYATPETEPQRKPESDEIIFTYNKQDYSMPIKDNKILFSRIYDSPGLNAGQLYDNARLSLTTTFKSINDGFHIDDKEKNIIVVKGHQTWENTQDVFSMSFDVYFTIKIECRDERYKISIYNFTSTNQGFGMRIEVTEQECYEKGFKGKNNSVRNNIYGLSWPAWYEAAHTILQEVSAMMAKSNKHDDW